MRGVDEVALSIDRTSDHIRVLSDLSEDVVGALLDEGERAPSEGDPFAAALRRYQEEGHPAELTGPWRQAMAPSPVAASARTANVLRLLARDLLSCIAARGPEPEPAEPEGTPDNVRPISGGPAAPIPALELASDGTWRPSTAAGVAADADVSQRRQAHVPSMSSRYPTVRAAGPLVVLPPAPSASAAATTTPPSGSTALRTPPSPESPTRTPPPTAAPSPPIAPAPPPAVPTPATVETHKDESVIQAVSGGTEVIAGPFAHFQELAAFSKALRELPGVQTVTIRQFVRGLVDLRVRHSSTMDLAAGLLTLTDFSPSIASGTPSRIELRVGSPDDVPPARD